MPKLEYFLVAESLAVDQASNQVSVFNILEELRPAILPAVIPQMAALCAWNMEEADDGQDFQALLRIVPPGGETREQRFNFIGQPLRNRVILRIIGLPVEAPGALRFEVELNGKHQATHTVTVLPLEHGAAQ